MTNKTFLNIIFINYLSLISATCVSAANKDSLTVRSQPMDLSVFQGQPEKPIRSAVLNWKPLKNLAALMLSMLESDYSLQNNLNFWARLLTKEPRHPIFTNNHFEKYIKILQEELSKDPEFNFTFEDNTGKPRSKELQQAIHWYLNNAEMAQNFVQSEHGKNSVDFASKNSVSELPPGMLNAPSTVASEQTNPAPSEEDLKAIHSAVASEIQELSRAEIKIIPFLKTWGTQPEFESVIRKLRQLYVSGKKDEEDVKSLNELLEKDDACTRINYVYDNHKELTGRSVDESRSESAILTPDGLRKIWNLKNALVIFETLKKEKKTLLGLGISTNNIERLLCKNDSHLKISSLIKCFDALVNGHNFDISQLVEILSKSGGHNTLDALKENFGTLKRHGMTVKDCVIVSKQDHAKNTIDGLVSHFSELVRRGFSKDEIVRIAQCRNGGTSLATVSEFYSGKEPSDRSWRPNKNQILQIICHGYGTKNLNTGLTQYQNIFNLVQSVSGSVSPKFSDDFVELLSCEQGYRNVEALKQTYEPLIKHGFTALEVFAIGCTKDGHLRLRSALQYANKFKPSQEDIKGILSILLTKYGHEDLERAICNNVAINAQMNQLKLTDRAKAAAGSMASTQEAGCIRQRNNDSEDDTGNMPRPINSGSEAFMNTVENWAENVCRKACAFRGNPETSSFVVERTSVQEEADGAVLCCFRVKKVPLNTNYAVDRCTQTERRVSFNENVLVTQETQTEPEVILQPVNADSAPDSTEENPGQSRHNMKDRVRSRLQQKHPNSVRK